MDHPITAFDVLRLSEGGVLLVLDVNGLAPVVIGSNEQFANCETVSVALSYVQHAINMAREEGLKEGRLGRVIEREQKHHRQEFIDKAAIAIAASLVLATYNNLGDQAYGAAEELWKARERRAAEDARQRRIWEEEAK